MDNDILKEFEKLGLDASTHYASENVKEWRNGKPLEDKALQLFDDNPDLQDDMRQIALKFLWPLGLRRPREEFKKRTVSS